VPASIAAGALALVPGAHGDAPVRVDRLLGGSVNDSWRVETAAGRFVLRLDGAAWRRPGVDRARERLLHGVAAAAGLAPRMITHDEALGALVSEHLAGRIWAAQDFSCAAQLERLGERLARLHELAPPPAAGRFDPVDCALGYLGLMNVERASAPGTAVVLAGLRAAVLEVDAAGAGPRIIHGDLVHGNLVEGERLWMLDWEYAQVADPIYDVACVLAYYPQAGAQASRLIAAAGLELRGAAARLQAAAYVYRGLSWLWHQARAEAADHPGTYP